jgi:hypothetical protein
MQAQLGSPMGFEGREGTCLRQMGSCQRQTGACEAKARACRADGPGCEPHTPSYAVDTLPIGARGVAFEATMRMCVQQRHGVGPQ